MISRHLSKIRFSLSKILFLGCLLLGIGFISLATIGILKQSDNVTYASLAPIKKVTSVGIHENPGILPDVLPLPIKEQLKASDFVEGEKIGTLFIPILKKTLPIIQGTSDASLKKGVGHYVQSVFPGMEDNTVLSGHRDTVFRNLGKLRKGDLLKVETSAGTFTYQINSIRIVHENDKTVIVPTEKAVLTLTTCYPFIYVGHAPDRYIVAGILIRSE